MISNNRVIEILKESGVLQEGHFLLTSGRHADKYLQCARVLQYPDYTGELAEGIASLWDKNKIDVVIGPAIGGIIVSYAVGQALGRRTIFTERTDGKMNLRRSFQIKDKERVLIVEDVVTTGGSVMEVIKLLEERKNNIVGISPIVDRSGGKVSFKYPYRPLLTMDIKTYSPDDCPLCKANIPFTKPGSR
jgi:orotate phosphoribosyltransferase